MIEVKNIFKSFGNSEVLKEINSVFNRGKTNLIIGQSGSGKTVLLKCLLGLYDVDSGDIVYDGISSKEMSKNDKLEISRQMGMVFQGSALFDSMNVLENVRFPLDMLTNIEDSEKNARAMKFIERVNLEDAINKLPSELSGGMQKRVAIARAVVMNPKYLFCDEPNSGLDPKTAILIDNLIQEITIEYNITTIVNTHDMNSVIQIGDNIAFIHKGEMWWKGNKDNLFKSNNKELSNFVFASKLFKRLKQSS